MGDSENNKPPAASIPSWQQSASTTADDIVSQASSRESLREQARKFLREESVWASTREKKADFLRSKGLEEADINKLLEECDEATTKPTTTEALQPQQTSQSASTAIVSSTAAESKADHPPIVTYPEFLTKPAKPLPLITASGLLNSLGLISGLSTIVYGATKYLVSPMVDTLTEARIDFHDNVNKNLAQLVEKLEKTVSEIPATYHAKKPPGTSHALEDDDDSSYDDPTELFHRDVGVQTSPPSTPGSSDPGLSFPSNYNQKPTSAATIQQQADMLNRLTSSIRALSTDLVSQAEDLAETKNMLDKFNQEVHTLTYPPESFGVGATYLYGSARSEPDDEIKRVKNSIRSVKGVLLSTKSFPASTR